MCESEDGGGGGGLNCVEEWRDKDRPLHILKRKKTLFRQKKNERSKKEKGNSKKRKAGQRSGHVIQIRVDNGRMIQCLL